METCWLQITAGRGPEECARAVFLLLRALSDEAAQRDIRVDCLEIIQGEHPKTLRSALLSLAGKDCAAFIRSWEGTIQWIAQSPFRPRHKRKNWFVGVQQVVPPEEKELGNKDFRFESMRASGPGGQHVNKVNSAIRVTHLPTGLTAMAQEERSQHMNKKLALTRLLARIQEEQNARVKQSQQEQWGLHNELERGNPVRVFQGERFQEKKG
ncbi:MAG: peptide chain release factor H [Candidatus Electrothrix aestuarii]|uniref:Peptide chain release factor H n=1 Tax=Candidatus Electrothrix aestuarii TaxID=3062594 RepID=A0AAU8LW56_9BACT|nr:peptide chain release factor H [Candidatus Electrothrix aestuarii]